jgi:hypothetical protein
MNIDEVYHLERFSKTRAEFDDFYDQELQSLVKKLEQERLAIMNMKTILTVAFLVVVVAAGISYFYFNSELIAVGIGGLYVFVAMAAFYDLENRERKLKEDSERKIVPKLVRFMNPNFSYHSIHWVPIQHYRSAHIFDEPNGYGGGDLITGFVGNDESKTDLMFSETSAELVRGRKRTRKENSFQGMFFVADFHKDFEGLTVVIPRNHFKNYLASSAKRSDLHLEEVKLENLEFMEEFEVYTTDQIKARYILTPSFMNRLLDFSLKSQQRAEQNADTERPKSLKQEMKVVFGKAQDPIKVRKEETFKPYFSFRDGRMYFLLATGVKHFVFDMESPISKNIILNHFDDINRALELVDELNLNLRIWNKE